MTLEGITMINKNNEEQWAQLAEKARLQGEHIARMGRRMGETFVQLGKALNVYKAR